jgi:hypothetical protein
VSAVLDVEAGRVVATRRQLDALQSWVLGRGDPDDPVVGELASAGLIARGVVHPAVNPVVAVLGSVVARAAVRRWCGGRRPIVEVLVGTTGVLVLPGGHEVDAAQELRWHPRPTAVARVLAEVLGAPAHDGPPVFGPGRRPWAELVAAAGAPGGVALADLRWSSRPGAPLTSVMVLAWAPDGGVVEVVPVDGRPGCVTCRPRAPLDVWSGLTTLCRQVTRG